jgi:hypothetical protein
VCTTHEVADNCEFCVPLDDPGERRRSLSTVVEEDTDMRMHLFDDANDININMIMQEADEQLKNGTISIPHYNTVLKQVSIICYIIQKVLLTQNCIIRIESVFCYNLF